jgi:hypothetical protein
VPGGRRANRDEDDASIELATVRCDYCDAEVDADADEITEAGVVGVGGRPARLPGLPGADGSLPLTLIGATALVPGRA